MLHDMITSIKPFMRAFLVLVAIVLTAPVWMVVKVALALGSSDDLFLTGSQITSIVPGTIGVYLRRGYYVMTLERCAWDCSIGCATWLSHPSVTIGSRVYIGGRCSVGVCEIGDDVLIGSNVDILSGRRQHNSNDPNVPRNAQGGTFTKVRIGYNAWIGNSSVIMADVDDNSVIGAGSVVVKPIPPNSVAVGNPATVKKTSE